MQALAKISGTWKIVRQIFVKQGGVWKTVKQGYIKSGGVWKLFFTLGFTAQPQSFVLSSHAASTDLAEISLTGMGVTDHGALLSDLFMSQNYDSGDENSVTSWTYRMMYDSSSAPPSWSGNLKVTNLSSGISVTLSPTADPRTWLLQIPSDGSQTYPVSPYDKWIRDSMDTYSISEA